MAGVSKYFSAGSRKGAEEIFLITGFLILIIFYMAYRLNRDEEIIVMLQERVTELEKNVKSFYEED